MDKYSKEFIKSNQSKITPFMQMSEKSLLKLANMSISKCTDSYAKNNGNNYTVSPLNCGVISHFKSKQDAYLFISSCLVVRSWY